MSKKEEMIKVSATRMIQFMKCEQEAAYNKEGWIVPKVKMAKSFGTFFHGILCDLYDGLRKGKYKGIPSDKIIKKAIKNAEKELMDEVKQFSSPQAIQAAEIIIGWAEVMIKPYCEYWLEDFKPKVWYSLESKFTVEWKGFLLNGRRDGLRWVTAKRTKKKSLWILETKTKGKIEEDTLLDTLNFDFQNGFYVTASEEELQLEDPAAEIGGVIYNIIRRPNQKLKKDESIKDFIIRVGEDIVQRPDHYFKRFEVTYTKADKKRFQRDLLIKLDMYCKWYRGETPTIRRECNCTAGYRCDFLMACASYSMAGYVKRKEKSKTKVKKKKITKKRR